VKDIVIMVRGAGEQASGVAHRLYGAHFKVFMTEIPNPLCIRRMVSFCECIIEGSWEVEGVRARHVPSPDGVWTAWEEKTIPVLIDPEGKSREAIKPHVIVDAILAKRNTGTRRGDAPLVIGLGPGFWAGKDVDIVIETNRGHNLGRIIREGPAEADTGIPGVIGGVGAQRVLRAPADGIFHPVKGIGDLVHAGEMVARVDGEPMVTSIDGVIRGLLRENTKVHAGLKAGDVDPRGILGYCHTISDKARALGGAVLEAILNRYNV